MEVTASTLCSKKIPFGASFVPTRRIPSLKPFSKQLVFRDYSGKTPISEKNVEFSGSSLTSCHSVFIGSGCTSSMKRMMGPFGARSVLYLSCAINARLNLKRPSLRIKCSNTSSEASANSEPQELLQTIFKILSPEVLKSSLSQVTSFGVFKWSLLFLIAFSASKWTVNLLFSPFFWMYFSWTWLFWPWMVAIGLAIYGLYSLNRHIRGESSLLEQLAIITSVFTWLTLVPPAHFNGFLEGWPFVFFFVYHYFFFLSVSVRKRMYGDYYPRDHDSKWDISLPNWHKLLFSVGVMVGHWLAAFEGMELHLIPGGWNNVVVWVLIISCIFMQYNSTLYLAKYSKDVVVPTDVVQFGPYRFVRHPIYASTMLLFTSYFAALRAPLSALFMVVVCLAYYGQKIKLEEALMIETFGERYIEYTNKIRFKLIPFVY